jgi:hypothetical protein
VAFLPLIMSDDHPAGSYSPPAPVHAEPAGEGGSSPAWRRFHACRWHKAADAGAPAYCTHRDVAPMAGTAGFSAEAWCPDCAHYKLKRIVRRPSNNW